MGRQTKMNALDVNDLAEAMEKFLCPHAEEYQDNLLLNPLEPLYGTSFPEEPGIYAIYAIRETEEMLLYVGMSKNLKKRLQQHRTNFSNVDANLQIRYAIGKQDDSRYWAERRFIRWQEPRLNMANNPKNWHRMRGLPSIGRTLRKAARPLNSL